MIVSDSTIYFIITEVNPKHKRMICEIQTVQINLCLTASLALHASQGFTCEGIFQLHGASYSPSARGA